MKKTGILKRILVLAMSVAVLAGSSAFALGEEIRHASTPIGTGTQLARGVYYTYNLQTENYIIYTPNLDITPVVVYGSKVCNYGDFKSMAALLEKKGYNVIGGINGDYYELKSYQPVSLVITDGILRSSDGQNWAIGFRADGTAFIDKPSMSMKIHMGNETYNLSGINKLRNSKDYCLFTEDFSYTTKNASPGRDVILSAVPDETGRIPPLTMNCRISLRVEQILNSEQAIELPEGKYVLSLAETADSWRQQGIDNLAVGDTITLEVSSKEIWDSAVYAAGSYVKLISNGALDPVGVSEAVKGTHPRTAVGILADGSILLYTIDGRQNGYSGGLTPEETGQRLLELGCVEALLLDGGGSTNMNALYIGDNELTQINRPSEGKERSVTNYIMLAAKNPGSGAISNLGVYPYDAVMLAGSTAAFRAGASDETGRAVAITGEVTWGETSGLGSINRDGLFTAGRIPGNTMVTASVGGLGASAALTIIDTPSTISVRNEKTGGVVESIKVLGGETIDLTATATYRYLNVLCSDDAFTWSLIGDIGAIDENGVFTASVTEGSGRIMVSAGDTAAAVDVEIDTDNETLEDFESGTLSYDILPSVNLIPNIEVSKEYVRMGNSSLKLEYDLKESPAYLHMPLKVSSGMGYMSLWVYGDNSGNLLQAEFESGALADIATMDFSGWRQVVIPLAERGADIRSFYLWGGGSGTIWIDHIMASSSPVPDLTPPQIELEVNNGIISGKIVDDINDFPPKSRIELLFDGKRLDFSYDVSKGTLKASIPEEFLAAAGDESGEETGQAEAAGGSAAYGIHKITLRNWDKSGNVASKSVLIKADGLQTVFNDMQEHWSYDYVNFMNALGVVNGMETENGLAYFPDRPVTRAQFAVMISRWLNVDEAKYADAQLQYADMESIPDYALGAVKAISSMGIIKGMERDGVLYFEPSRTLTRAQAMTIIGRIQRAGYPEAELGFSDAAEVPDWALKYVKTLVYQNVITGFEDGRLAPNGELTRGQVAKILTEVT